MVPTASKVLICLCRLADTIHLVHVVSSVNSENVYEASHGLMQRPAMEAVELMTEAPFVQGEVGKVICKEAKRLKPAAVVMSTQGRSLVQSAGKCEHCFHNCESASVITFQEKAIPGFNKALIALLMRESIQRRRIK